MTTFILKCRNCNAPLKSSSGICEYCKTPFSLKEVSKNYKQEVNDKSSNLKTEGSEEKILKKWGFKQTFAEFFIFIVLGGLFSSFEPLLSLFSFSYALLVMLRFSNFIGFTNSFGRRYERFITKKTTFF